MYYGSRPAGHGPRSSPRCSNRSGRCPHQRRAETVTRGLTHPRQTERRQPARNTNDCIDAHRPPTQPARRHQTTTDRPTPDLPKPIGGSKLRVHAGASESSLRVSLERSRRNISRCRRQYWCRRLPRDVWRRRTPLSGDSALGTESELQPAVAIKHPSRFASSPFDVTSIQLTMMNVGLPPSLGRLRYSDPRLMAPGLRIEQLGRTPRHLQHRPLQGPPLLDQQPPRPSEADHAATIPEPSLGVVRTTRCGGLIIEYQNTA